MKIKLSGVNAFDARLFNTILFPIDLNVEKHKRDKSFFQHSHICVNGKFAVEKRRKKHIS